jgi:ArsR family metal-binding transcriptional regulator
MLLTAYQKRMLWSPCNPTEKKLQCMADLDADISKVLPYMNALLRGFQYLDDPPSVAFKIRGRIIVLHPSKISINSVENEIEADAILSWLLEVINRTWERRNEIEPSFAAFPKPNVVEILRRLEGETCSECGEPSCLSFALQLADGEKSPDDCPMLPEEKRERIKAYLAQVQHEDMAYSLAD